MRRIAGMALLVAAFILAAYTFLKPSQNSLPQDLTLRKSFLKGQNFFEEGKWEQAAEQFQKDLVLDPKNSQAHLQLAILYDDYLGQKEKAVEQYEAYLNLTPKDEKSLLIRQWLQKAKEEIGQNPAPVEIKGDSQALRQDGTGQAQLKKAEDALRALRQDYQRVETERDEQSLTLQRLRETLSEKEKKLSGLQAQSSKAQLQKSDQEKLQGQLKKDKESLALQVQELTNSKAELEERFKALERLQARRDQESLTNQRQRVLAYENKKLKERIKDLEAEGMQLAAQIEALKVSYGNLKKQFIDLQTKARANEKARARLTAMRKYRVKKGESLRTIATLIYGNKDKWRMIYAANRNRIVDPDLLTPGQVLDIPPDASSR